MIIDKQLLKELEKYDDLFSRFLNGKRVFTSNKLKKELLVYYNAVSGEKGSCFSCNNNWIRRLALWVEESKEHYAASAAPGTPGKLSKAILQYDLEGHFIREWKSVNQVSKELQIATSSIHGVLKGKFKQVKGFIFKYKED